jgi:hypothetical protein
VTDVTTAAVALPEELARAAIAPVIAEYGDECFIAEGMGAGDDLLKNVAEKIRDARRADEGLLARAVRNARDRSTRGYHTRWKAVMQTFCIGSTYAQALCRRFGLDPEEKVR